MLRQTRGIWPSAKVYHSIKTDDFRGTLTKRGGGLVTAALINIIFDDTMMMFSSMRYMTMMATLSLFHRFTRKIKKLTYFLSCR